MKNCPCPAGESTESCSQNRIANGPHPLALRYRLLNLQKASLSSPPPPPWTSHQPEKRQFLTYQCPLVLANILSSTGANKDPRAQLCSFMPSYPNKIKIYPDLHLKNPLHMSNPPDPLLASCLLLSSHNPAPNFPNNFFSGFGVRRGQLFLSFFTVKKKQNRIDPNPYSQKVGIFFFASLFPSVPHVLPSIYCLLVRTKSRSFPPLSSDPFPPQNLGPC